MNIASHHRPGSLTQYRKNAAPPCIGSEKSTPREQYSPGKEECLSILRPSKTLQLGATETIPTDGQHGSGHLAGRLRVNGLEGGRVRPGEPALLEMDFRDPKTGQRLVDFEEEHEKLLHTLIVSDDLSSFAHVHPKLSCEGVFRIGINQPNDDPDSQGALEAVTKSGQFIVFNEVKPVGQGVQKIRLGLESAGPASSVSLTPDTISPNGSIRKFFGADGKEGDPGARYQVTLSKEQPGDDSSMMHFKFNLQTAHHGDHYQPIENVDTWLGMPGHAVMIGARGGWEEKEFRHLHAGGGHDEHETPVSPPTVIMDGGHPPHDPPGGGGGGPDFTFMLDDIPPSGVYKIWAQFKHDGEVRTFPFVLQL